MKRYLDDHLSHKVLFHHDVAANQLLHQTRELTASQEMLDTRRHLYTRQKNMPMRSELKKRWRFSALYFTIRGGGVV